MDNEWRAGAGGEMYRILTFTSLFPNAEQARHGIFIETRLRKLLETESVDARVIAPVPWFPLRSQRMGRFGAYARVPFHEKRHGIDIQHPRFLSFPGMPKRWLPYSMALGALPAARALLRSGFDFDLIDAHFYYPDGVAAALLGKWMRKPVMITARGSDITFWPSQRVPRQMILRAAGQARCNAGVSQALVDEMVRLGCAPDRVVVLRNGVDLALFHEEARAATRQGLHAEGVLALSVGNLIELKGHHLAIEAIAGLPGASLVIIGAGPEEGRLRALADRLGASQRVRFLGVLPQAELRRYYSAADVLVLASSREGWPNVLLEAMACGTRVVATDVWGIGEIVSAPEAGELISERTADAVRDGIERVIERRIDRQTTRRFAEGFSWEDTSQAQLEAFARITCRGPRPAGWAHARDSNTGSERGACEERTGNA